MRAGGKLVLTLVGVATLLVTLAEPAEARRRIRFGGWGSHGSSSSGYAEKIDKVYDLPDTGAYFHDGKYYDLGAFYQIRDGAEIYPAEPSFVLYNNDRYVKLGGAELTILTADLGMDPTASYRANYAAKVSVRPKSANEIERLPGETNEQLRDRVRKMAGERGAGASKVAEPAGAARVGGNWLMAFFLPMLIIGGLFAFGLRKFLRKRVAAVIAAEPDAHADLDTGSFDQRIAARLRELNGGQGGAAAPAGGPAMPAPRTFGRKVG
jgi:hypothetical protein